MRCGNSAKISHCFQKNGCVVSLQAFAAFATKPDKTQCAQTLAFLPKVLYNTCTVLGGELAVPCCLQSATVGPNVAGGFLRGKPELARSVDIKVLCNVTL